MLYQCYVFKLYISSIHFKIIDTELQILQASENVSKVLQIFFETSVQIWYYICIAFHECVSIGITNQVYYGDGIKLRSVKGTVNGILL